MTIRDLGYRAYKGERLPASHNIWVLLRHGLSRAWSSWIVKLATLLGIGPSLIMAAIMGSVFFFTQQMQAAQAPPMEGGRWLSMLFSIQLWLFASVVTLRCGASVIAEDFNNRAFQFFFAKPVTPPQYLLGRMLALGSGLFLLFFIPSVPIIALLAGTAGSENVAEMMGLTLPCLLASLIGAASLSVLSISVSAISRSRALTMSTWLVIFVVPHVLARLVEATTDSGWLYLISIPGLLGILTDSLLKVTRDDPEVLWYHAAAALSVFCIIGGWASMLRIDKAEVIT